MIDRDDLIRMAHEAGFNMVHYSNKEPLLCEAWGDQINLGRFAELVAAAEREACAKIVETAPDCLQDSTFSGAARAIRARGNG